MTQTPSVKLERIDACRVRIPKDAVPGMRVDGIIYADETLMKSVGQDPCVSQVANVATLPGIVKHSLAMPDIHFGYGFCIGGVAATDPENGGVISPGGVGYDINCGVRLIRSDLAAGELRSRVAKLTDSLFQHVPCGVGEGGEVRLKGRDLDDVLSRGSAAVIERGYGVAVDVEVTEARSRRAGRSRSRLRLRPGPAARAGPVRHARLGQPLRRDPGGGRGLRRRGRRIARAERGSGDGDDSLRLPRAGSPGVRRRHPRPAGRAEGVRHRPA